MELKELIMKAKENDIAAKEELLNRFKPFIIKQCTRVYLKDYTFDDLMQICYLSLLKAIEKFNIDNDNFIAYATVSIKNNLNYLIRQKAKINYEVSIYKETGENIEFIDTLKDDFEIEKSFFHNEMVQCLISALHALPYEERYIIESIYFCNKSLKDLSNELNIKYITLAKRKERILKKLKKLLDVQ